MRQVLRLHTPTSAPSPGAAPVALLADRGSHLCFAARASSTTIKRRPVGRVGADQRARSVAENDAHTESCARAARPVAQSARASRQPAALVTRRRSAAWLPPWEDRRPINAGGPRRAGRALHERARSHTLALPSPPRRRATAVAAVRLLGPTQWGRPNAPAPPLARRPRSAARRGAAGWRDRIALARRRRCAAAACGGLPQLRPALGTAAPI